MVHPFQADIKGKRSPEYPIHPFILDRWSPRSMTGEHISDEELFSLFEAAKWAPSSYNNQPWRFIYAKKDTSAWNPLFDLMIDFNKSWAKNAAALILIISKKTFDHNGKPCRTHSFDTGAAWMALALEGASRGFTVHGMEGFDYEKAAQVLNIPSDYQIEALVAVGKRAPASQLSTELQQKEMPSSRKSVHEFIMEGKFKNP